MKKHLFIFGLVIAFQAQSQEQKKDSCSRLNPANSCCMYVDYEYAKIRNRADFYFYNGNYKKALDLYQRMLALRKNDWYPRMQAERMKVYIEKGF